MTITDEQDKTIRKWAKSMDPEDGENAYHDVVCEILERKTGPQNIIALCISSIRQRLLNIYKKRVTNDVLVASYLAGNPPAYTKQVKTDCKNGHRYTPDSTLYQKTPRGTESPVCRICREESLARYAKRRSLKLVS